MQDHEGAAEEVGVVREDVVAAGSLQGIIELVEVVVVRGWVAFTVG